jgi:protocatechuate 3,4-dioxygenase beta subunit
MKFSSRRLLVVAALTLSGVWLWHAHNDRAAHAPDSAPTATATRTAKLGPVAQPLQRNGTIAARSHRSFSGALVIGRVRLARARATANPAFDDVEVVFSNQLGETSTMANADGSFEIELMPGAYRVMARGEHVMTTVIAEHDGLWMPGWAEVGAAAAYAPSIIVADDVAGVDVAVTEIAKITGHVRDGAGRPIVGATIHSLAGDGEKDVAMRPGFGTDIGISDEAGAYELLVPVGEYQINATHPYFGMVAGEKPWIEVAAAAPQQVDLEMMRGCIVAGRVLNTDGTPAHGGHIEISPADNQAEMRGAATIGDDGTFQWTGLPEQPIALRGWSWRSAPSPAQVFSCRDGARFENIVFQIPASEPALDGTMTGPDGEPLAGVKFAIVALTNAGQGQVERTDAAGNFAVYAMPPGEYEIVATTPDGAIAKHVTVPAHHVELTLGRGTVVATVKGIDDGSLKISMQCSDGLQRGDEQLVHVQHGRFEVPAPACNIIISASSPHRHAQVNTRVSDGQTAEVQLDLTPPHRKVVTGVVTNTASLPAAGVTVNAFAPNDGTADAMTSATTDAAGHYRIETVSGATIFASSPDEGGYSEVTSSDTATETVDIAMTPATGDIDGCADGSCDTSGDMEYYGGHGASDENGDSAGHPIDDP